MPLLHRVLIVGVGSIGERHVRCFQKTDRAAVSICEPNESLRDRIASEYEITQAYATLEDAICDEHDAALIATPAHMHIPIALVCAQAGFHLLIEKPLALTLENIDLLQKTVERKKLVANVAYVWRAHPILVRMKEAMDSGRFGRPLQLYNVSGSHFPSFRPAYRRIYYNSRATGGGAIQDAMTHGLNMGEWLVGPMTHLFADADHLHLEDVNVEDTVHVMARHGNVMSSYSLNQYQSSNDYSVTVVCERGTLRFEAHYNRWRWMDEPNSEWHEEMMSDLKRDDMYIAQANTFLDTVEGKQSPACSLQEGLQTLKAVRAILSVCDSPAWKIV